MKLEHDARLLKRACALLLALLATGIMILQGVLRQHVDAPTNPHHPRGVRSEREAPAPADQR